MTPFKKNKQKNFDRSRNRTSDLTHQCNFLHYTAFQSCEKVTTNGRLERARIAQRDVCGLKITKRLEGRRFESGTKSKLYFTSKNKFFEKNFFGQFLSLGGTFSTYFLKIDFLTKNSKIYPCFFEIWIEKINF